MSILSILLSLFIFTGCATSSNRSDAKAALIGKSKNTLKLVTTFGGAVFTPSGPSDEYYFAVVNFEGNRYLVLEKTPEMTVLDAVEVGLGENEITSYANEAYCYQEKTHAFAIIDKKIITGHIKKGFRPLRAWIFDLSQERIRSVDPQSVRCELNLTT